jgi:methylated-DNA-protein-cysteine methyltransferase-like protein
MEVNYMLNEDAGFGELVESVVSEIPKGKVMTYGQIAALCGNARMARIVGGVAHFGDPLSPWQRVVNINGGLASGYPGGRQAHQKALEAEGVKFTESKLELNDYLYQPEAS